MPRASSTSSRYGRSRSIERRGADQHGARIADPPGHEDAAGIIFVAFDHELVAAEVRAAEPGEIVLAAHVNVFEPAGRNAIAIVDD